MARKAMPKVKPVKFKTAKISMKIKIPKPAKAPKLSVKFKTPKFKY